MMLNVVLQAVLVKEIFRFEQSLLLVSICLNMFDRGYLHFTAG